MDRLTKRQEDGQAVMNCQNCQESWINKPSSNCSALYCRNRLKDRVADYEDTGLEPQDILSATDMAKIACALHELNKYKELGDLDRLRELLEADREGRCVVYLKGFPVASTYLKEGGLYIRETSGVISHEEYRAALKGERDG